MTTTMKAPPPPVKGDSPFARLLVRRRREIGFTQKYLAQQCGVSLRTWLRWEGDRNLPKVQMAPRIAEALLCDAQLVIDALIHTQISPDDMPTRMG